MSKRVLVLSANPKKESFVDSLAEAYVNSATKGFDVQFLKLSDMQFDPDLSAGYDQPLEMEESLSLFQVAIAWCDHLVVFTPIWWGALPAKLKGLFDRAFLPGFAFQYESGKSIPKKLLRGKTARIVMTMDTPPWYYWLVQRAPAMYQLKVATLKFVGFKQVKSKMLGPIINSTEASRNKWIDYAYDLGLSAK